MKLSDAKCCLNPACREVFEKQDTCPKCGYTAWQWLYIWLNPDSEAAQLHAGLSARFRETHGMGAA